MHQAGNPMEWWKKNRCLKWETRSPTRSTKGKDFTSENPATNRNMASYGRDAHSPNQEGTHKQKEKLTGLIQLKVEKLHGKAKAIKSPSRLDGGKQAWG